MAPALLGGYAADLVVGDPRRLHPVAGFGKLALGVERVAYAPTRGRGAVYAAGLIGCGPLAGEARARAACRAGLGRGAALLALLPLLGEPLAQLLIPRVPRGVRAPRSPTAQPRLESSRDG